MFFFLKLKFKECVCFSIFVLVSKYVLVILCFYSPYIIDLNTTNGTKLNGDLIQAGRYIELLENDVLKFGFSSRDYVVLHSESNNEKS